MKQTPLKVLIRDEVRKTCFKSTLNFVQNVLVIINK